MGAAHAAFHAMTTPATDDEKRTALVEMRMPEQVQKITAMLTAYEWEFVNQARELRSFVVGRLVEETKDAKGSIRLKALELLGKVTEVGLFTEKVQVATPEVPDEELDARIKERLAKLRGVLDVIAPKLTVSDVTDKPVA